MPLPPLDALVVPEKPLPKPGISHTSSASRVVGETLGQRGRSLTGRPTASDTTALDDRQPGTESTPYIGPSKRLGNTAKRKTKPQRSLSERIKESFQDKTDVGEKISSILGRADANTSNWRFNQIRPIQMTKKPQLTQTSDPERSFEIQQRSSPNRGRKLKAQLLQYFKSDGGVDMWEVPNHRMKNQQQNPPRAPPSPGKNFWPPISIFRPKTPTLNDLHAPEEEEDEEEIAEPKTPPTGPQLGPQSELSKSEVVRRPNQPVVESDRVEPPTVYIQDDEGGTPEY